MWFGMAGVGKASRRVDERRLEGALEVWIIWSKTVQNKYSAKQAIEIFQKLCSEKPAETREVNINNIFKAAYLKYHLNM